MTCYLLIVIIKLLYIMERFERIDAKLIIADLVKHERLLMEDLYDAYEIARKQKARKQYRIGLYWIPSELTKYYDLNIIMQTAEDSRYPFDIRVMDITRYKIKQRADFIHAVININEVLQDKVFAEDKQSIYRLG